MTAAPGISAAEFAAKWRENARRENASSQEHFIDLCHLLGVQTPNEADPVGEWYAFEAGAERTSTGRQGRADVWKREHFGWEYKGAHADLGAAYRQLLDYREDLENPPALIVSDMDLIEVHTNFTGTRPDIHRVTLDALDAGSDRTAEALRVLRAVMLDPEALRPEQTPLTRSPRPPRRASPRSRAPCTSAATTPRRWPTTSTALSSACSPRTPGYCR